MSWYPSFPSDLPALHELSLDFPYETIPSAHCHLIYCSSVTVSAGISCFFLETTPGSVAVCFSSSFASPTWNASATTCAAPVNTEKFGRLRQNIRQHEEDHIQTFVLTRLLHKRQHTVLQLSKLLCIQELI